MSDPGIRALFQPEPGLAYLDAATYGLPPAPTIAAMDRATAMWRAGTAYWVTDWDRPAEDTRADFATLIGATAADIALIPAVSVGVGLIANTLGPDDVVVVADDEFRSDLFPLLVAERRHGTTIRQVPFAGIADAIVPGTTFVAASLVQMQTGRVADLAAICERAKVVGAKVFLDSTHGTPFVPVAPHIADIDFLVCHAYKHLLSPRGTTFLYVRADHVEEVPPLFAGWRNSHEPWSNFFRGPLDLVDDAGRFTVSLAWLAWVGTRESLRLIVEWSRAGVLAEPLALAAAFRDAIGSAPSASTLVCVPTEDPERVRAALEAAHIRAAVRGDGIRFSPHVWNDAADVERAVAVVEPFVRRPGRAPSSA